jgi:methylenetetrahydrofolate reductase (NADPH)
VREPITSPAVGRVRFELLPLERGLNEAERLPRPVRLTVTCSPRHGPDRGVEVARRLHALGHSVTVHIAARMVRDGAHLDALLTGMAEAGADDMFLIGGDLDPPQGSYSSAAEVLRLVAEHPRRPRTIGIAGYAEGHPDISNEALEEALREKGPLADYVTTQMCFHADAVLDWVARQRRQGMTLPVLIGMPGALARRRLLELSMRIGVGPSLAFVRKQRGLRALLSRRSTTDRLYDSLAPALDDPRLDIAGFHYFTFNQLIDTWEWQLERWGGTDRSEESALSGVQVCRGESAA